MDADRIVRVRYFDRQFLRPQDFTDEQAYHVAMRRRHNIAGHTWGILGGLDLTADGGPLAVQPGLAVDGYGREVVVIERMTVPPLPPAPITGEVAYDIWLVYDRVGSDTAPWGRSRPEAGGGDGACGSDATAYYRWQELPRLLITAADDAVDASHPPQVPPGDLAFGAERTAPEETAPWPVLLGRVRRTGSGLAIDPSGRRYAGLVAASVAHPRGDARIDLGPTAPTDPTRFAVRADSGTDPLFDIAATGTATVHGTLAVDGDLRIEGGALDFPVEVTGPPPAQTAQPWQVYGAQNGTRRELRVELPAGAANALVIGTWSADRETFTPCLTVRGDNTVTVHGNLTVQGSLSAPATAAQAPSAAVQALATGALLSGIGGAAGVAARLYRPQGTSASAAAVATALAADPELLRQVAAQLRQGYGDTAGTLAQHLGEG